MKKEKKKEKKKRNPKSEPQPKHNNKSFSELTIHFKWANDDENVIELTLYHSRVKRCITLLKQNYHNVIAKVSFPLNLLLVPGGIRY